MWKRAALTAAAVLLPLLTTPPPATAADSATVVPISITGDPGKRFNVVIIGDGYTAADMPKFRENLNRHVNVLMTLEPFKSYRSYLNVYAVEIPSHDSGVSCDPGFNSPHRDTPLHMGFYSGCTDASIQRALTVDNSAATKYANLVTGTNSGNRQVLTIANSTTYGGTGGTWATASGGNAMSALITPHEMGHSLGGLDDEYDYYARGERGAAYTGGEPDSLHHTLLTEQQMTAQHAKWWRWLGEPSESGGTIGRYESGLYSSTDVWRPSAHSMMKTLGYYFDQVSRERMTQRISAKTNILQDGTPTTAPIGADRVVWVDTLHPASHQLTTSWQLDGKALTTNGSRSLDLTTLHLAAGKHTLTAKVVDPTEFVRDPAVRDSAALTRTRTWTIDTSISTTRVPTAPDFTASTPTNRPVGGQDVLYAEATHPVDRIVPISWALDGKPVPTPGNDRDLELGRLGLTGTHTVTASVPGHTLTWQVDATPPSTSFQLSKALSTVDKPGQPPEYVFNAPFTMRLTASDNTPGYDVSEFRTDGDGWFNYFGWPTDASAPFLFTANGTVIDNLVYGKLGKPRLSPWDTPPAGYGRHTVEYRSTDPSGNTSAAGSFVVTLLPPPPTCTSTVTGHRDGPLVIGSGVTCLDGAEVAGPVTVAPGASLVVTGGSINSPVSASGAATVQLLSTTVRGPVSIAGTTGNVTVLGTQVFGAASLLGSHTADPAIFANSTVHGPLVCTANSPAPQDLQAANSAWGPVLGQCSGKH
ncbi:M64 family metallopeptidase [Kutzneria viridogrisea]|uniref:IgA peptidase M64 n=1 Tax=Kutzneria viridogrisea TaxID=47990 RepID=A0ABR6BY86_9PSEU|nr:hypothetical protein [Kutzneria viridogrisea]